LADAFQLAAAGAGAAFRFVVKLAARQVGGQRLALGLLFVVLALWRRLGLLDLGGQSGQSGQIGVDRRSGCAPLSAVAARQGRGFVLSRSRGGMMPTHAPLCISICANCSSSTEPR
jgi:hypothetical protein